MDKRRSRKEEIKRGGGGWGMRVLRIIFFYSYLAFYSWFSSWLNWCSLVDFKFVKLKLN
jgi:hypothetical protein